VTGGWRKIHNEELHNLYYTPSIIRMMKSRRMRWAGHVARMRENRNAHRLWVGKPEGKRIVHNEELHNLYSSLSIIRMIKSGWMRWAGHVARMRENRNAHRLSVGKPEGKRKVYNEELH
jgi:hypothetical protein